MTPNTTVMLPLGSRVAAVFADASAKRNFVQQLLRSQQAEATGEDKLLAKAKAVGRAGYVSHGTTLLSGFSVLDNLRIPVLYRHTVAEIDLSAQISLLCRVADIAPKLLAREAGEATPLERIQATFLQALVTTPELLLFDAVFDGLGAAEQTRVATLVAAFHRLYPLRRSIYLGYAVPPDQLYRATSTVEG